MILNTSLSSISNRNEQAGYETYHFAHCKPLGPSPACRAHRGSVIADIERDFRSNDQEILGAIDRSDIGEKYFNVLLPEFLKLAAGVLEIPARSVNLLRTSAALSIGMGNSFVIAHLSEQFPEDWAGVHIAPPFHLQRGHSGRPGPHWGRSVHGSEECWK